MKQCWFFERVNKIIKPHCQIRKNNDHIQKMRSEKVEIMQNTTMTQFIIKDNCDKSHAKTWKNRRNEYLDITGLPNLKP